jgi:hypothetical protein
MARTPPARKHGPFQEWLEQALDRRGITLAELSRMVDADYSHLWKILRGSPAKYPTSARPGFDLALSIGRELGDVDGALKAAGYDLPEDPAVEMTREADDLDQLIIRNVGGMDVQDKRFILEMTERIRRAGRDRSIGGKSAPRPPKEQTLR